MSTPHNQDAIVGCLLGGAVGDALGLPIEGLSPMRAAKLFGEISDDFGMRLLCGRGLVSDDTEHAIFTLQALIAARGDSQILDLKVFERELARRLKFWFLKLPPGTGLATAKACLKLLCGVSPARSGVLSAGNGPAMRAPILGVVCRDDNKLRELIKISTRMTHTDPKAEVGALAVALAARGASTQADTTPREFLSRVEDFLKQGDESDSAQEFLSLLERVVQSVHNEQSTPDFAATLGLQNGVSGYIFHTVPVVLHAWLSNQNDLRGGVLACLRCGGDADSTAAICGGIIGVRVGKQGVPCEWMSTLIEWPHGVQWMEKLSRRAVRHEPMPVSIVDLLVPARNAFLLMVVLAHGFRRLLPPY